MHQTKPLLLYSMGVRYCVQQQENDESGEVIAMTVSNCMAQKPLKVTHCMSQEEFGKIVRQPFECCKLGLMRDSG